MKNVGSGIKFLLEGFGVESPRQKSWRSHTTLRQAIRERPRQSCNANHDLTLAPVASKAYGYTRLCSTKPTYIYKAIREHQAGRTQSYQSSYHWCHAAFQRRFPLSKPRLEDPAHGEVSQSKYP